MDPARDFKYNGVTIYCVIFVGFCINMINWDPIMDNASFQFFRYLTIKWILKSKLFLNDAICFTVLRNWKQFIFLTAKQKVNPSKIFLELSLFKLIIFCPWNIKLSSSKTRGSDMDLFRLFHETVANAWFLSDHLDFTISPNKKDVFSS